MELAIQVCLYLIGVPLQLLVIASMLRGAYRRYPFVFFYIITAFLTTVIEMPSYLSYYSGNRSALKTLLLYYWIDEAISQALIYTVVISLIYHVTAVYQSRRVVRVVLIGGAFLFAVGSLAVHYDPALRYGHWMTPWSRDLNFCAAVLDLGLWALLIGSKVRDQQLLMLSGALGIQFTGQAIGSSLRHLADIENHSRLIASIGDVLSVATYLGSLFLIWQAFRSVEKTPPKIQTAPNHFVI